MGRLLAERLLVEHLLLVERLDANLKTRLNNALTTAISTVLQQAQVIQQDAKTRLNNALTTAISTVLQQALAGQVDVGVFVCVLAHACPAPPPAAGVPAGLEDSGPAPTNPDNGAPFFAHSSPTFPPLADGDTRPASDDLDDGAQDFAPA